MPRSEKGLKLTSKGEKMNHITTEQKGQTTKIDRFNAPFAAPEWLAAFAAQQVTHKVLTRLSWKSLGLVSMGLATGYAIYTFWESQKDRLQHDSPDSLIHHIH